MEIKSINVARKSKTSPGSRPKAFNRLAILHELTKVSGAILHHGMVDLPLKLTRAFLRDSNLEPLWQGEHFFDLIGDVLLGLFDSLGPVYGKMGQVALSHLSGPLQTAANRINLDRLYGNWPPIPFGEIENILDDEIPNWHETFKIDPHPIGVASMAQVHRASDLSGNEWAIKVIKPKARQRLVQSIAAIEQALDLARPLAMTDAAQRLIGEIEELTLALGAELDLDQEKTNIDRMRDKLKTKKQDILKIPATYPEFCTASVLTIEYFKGTPLSKFVKDPLGLSPAAKKTLAKKVLSQLLIQVFELGLFHADPHAGNLILLDDGSVGLFDWGLQGELLETDRRHVATILKAVIAMDLELIIDALIAIAQDEGQELEREDAEKELSKLRRLLDHHRENQTQPSLHELIEACLKAADRMNIPLPNGLLMMAKALLTIEGLAKGIDPDISFIRIATPVLFRAAKPGMKDIINFAKNAPKLAMKLFG